MTFGKDKQDYPSGNATEKRGTDKKVYINFQPNLETAMSLNNNQAVRNPYASTTNIRSMTNVNENDLNFNRKSTSMKIKTDNASSVGNRSAKRTKSMAGFDFHHTKSCLSKERER